MLTGVVTDVPATRAPTGPVASSGLRKSEYISGRCPPLRSSVLLESEVSGLPMNYKGRGRVRAPGKGQPGPHYVLQNADVAIASLMSRTRQSGVLHGCKYIFPDDLMFDYSI